MLKYFGFPDYFIVDNYTSTLLSKAYLSIYYCKCRAYQIKIIIWKTAVWKTRVIPSTVVKTVLIFRPNHFLYA